MKFPLPNVITRLPADNVTCSDGETVHVDYVPKDCGSKAGGLVRCELKPCVSATVSYKVRFNGHNGKPFDFVECGKMGPGFSFGEPGADGGCHKDHGGSLRAMWRVLGKDSKEASAVAYLYIPNEAAGNAKYDGENSKVYDVQGPGFRKLLHWTPGGDDLFRDAGMTLRGDGGWNDVEISVRMNSIGKKDGTLSLTVNGKTHSYETMLWRAHDSLKINQITFNSWFGGSDAKRYASPAGQSADFKDIVVKTA